MDNERVDGFAILALAFLIFLAVQLVMDRAEPQPALAMDEGSLNNPGSPELPTPAVIDYTSVGQPYEDYWVTQGVHGSSYGHMAIDISAGEGAEILSPIHGTVIASTVDGLGNPTLELENEVWQITLMHGEYIVRSGEQIGMGQVLGYESNLGYTTDLQGRSCAGRDCGYHTHINIFDKRLGINVNPLEVLQP